MFATKLLDRFPVKYKIDYSTSLSWINSSLSLCDLRLDSWLGPSDSRLDSSHCTPWLGTRLGPCDSRLDSGLGPLTRASHGRVTVESQLTFILPTYLLYTLFTNWGPNGTQGRSFRYHSLTVGILGKHFDKLWCIWTVYKMVQQIFFSTAHKSNMAAKTWIFSWKNHVKSYDFSPKCCEASDSNAVFGSFD